MSERLILLLQFKVHLIKCVTLVKFVLPHSDRPRSQDYTHTWILLPPRYCSFHCCS